MKKTIGIIVLLVAAGAIALWQRDVPDRAPTQTPLVTAENEVEAVSEGGEAINPVSLPALMQKQYDGRDLTLGRVLDDNEAYTRYYITYKSGDLAISGIMNIPKGTGPFPVLFLNHGHIDTAIYTNGRGLKREQDYLARRGYAVLHSDYRNHADSTDDPDNEVKFRLGYTEDVINAVYAVKNSNIPNLDKSKIGMLGHSMGGGVTINTLVVAPDLVQAAVLFAPVSADQRDNFERWLLRRPEVANAIIARYGKPEASPDFWDDISAKSFYDRIKTPILLHHGTADDSVPIAWSDRFNEGLKAENKAVDYRVYPGQPHEFTSDWLAVMQSTVEFFNKNLK